MARRRRGQQYTPKRVEPQRKSLAAMDGYINSLAYLGEASELQKASEYQRHSITGDFEKLTTLYRENWIAKKIIDTPCEDMTRAWYTVSSAVEQDLLDDLAKLEEKHDVKREITNAIRWARLYGGAAALMVIKGQEDMLEEPLDYDSMMPGCFRGLLVVDRTDGLYPSIELEDDMDDPEFGYPKYYTVNLEKTGTQVAKVHHSRLLLFHGRMLPNQEEVSEDYWGASELEHVYEELQKRDATSANIAQLVFQANVAALKMADYGEVIGMGTEKQIQQVYNAVYAQNRIRNSFGMMIMGSDDAYEQHPYSFAGIAEVYESFMLDMAGAAEIPATKLYGRAPQGMNATGESDLKNYYEMLAQLQERQLKPAITKLLPVMAMSLWGAVPNDMEIVFEPLMTTTPAERAQIVQQSAGAIIQAFSAGVISQKIAMAELQETGKPIGAWTNITQEDIDNAEEEVDAGEQMQDPMGGMGGMMPQEGPQAAPEMVGGQEPAPEEQAPEGATEAQKQQDDFSQMREAIMNAAKNGEIEKAKAIVRAHRVLNEHKDEMDGGPGSGPRPGYHKAGVIERAKFMANPTADLPEPQRQHNGPTGSAEQVEKMNREREDWSNLTTHQKVEGNAQMNRKIARMRKQVMELAAKGDIKGAKAIVKANRYLWANDPDSAQKVQSETLKMQKAVKPRRGLLDLFRKRKATDEFVESEHPRGKGGKFVKKGTGSETVSNVSAEKPIDNGAQKYNNNESGTKSFVKTAAKKFREVFHAAKAAVAKDRPQDAWRVDSTYTDDDYKDMDCFITDGGSAVAVHDGDIVSVCANPNDKTTRGRDLLAQARSMGGNKLDAFGNLYGFYIKNGFEPVSWCEFDEEYAPPDWVKGRDDPEPVIFFKYTGRSREEIIKDHGSDYFEFTSRVKASEDYFAAKEEREKSLKG